MQNEVLFQWFEQQGELAIRAQLMQANATGKPIEHAVKAQQWLLIKEEERRADREAEEKQRYDETLAAAVAAASASRSSARWTFWAAFAAFIAAAASWAQIFLTTTPPA